MNDYDAMGAAVTKLAAGGHAAEARMLSAVKAEAARQVLRCLDPRHGTTAEQAHEAVFAASPYSEAATYAREVIAR